MPRFYAVIPLILFLVLAVGCVQTANQTTTNDVRAFLLNKDDINRLGLHVNIDYDKTEETTINYRSKDQLKNMLYDEMASRLYFFNNPYSKSVNIEIDYFKKGYIDNQYNESVNIYAVGASTISWDEYGEKSAFILIKFDNVGYYHVLIKKGDYLIHIEVNTIEVPESSVRAISTTVDSKMPNP